MKFIYITKKKAKEESLLSKYLLLKWLIIAAFVQS